MHLCPGYTLISFWMLLLFFQPMFLTDPTILRVKASEVRRPPSHSYQGTQGVSHSLLILADVGTVLKVISVPKGSRPNGEGLLLEELHVFEVRSSLPRSPPPQPLCPPAWSNPTPLIPDPSAPPPSQDSAAITSMQISSKRVSDQKAWG